MQQQSENPAIQAALTSNNPQDFVFTQCPECGRVWWREYNPQAVKNHGGVAVRFDFCSGECRQDAMEFDRICKEADEEAA